VEISVDIQSQNKMGGEMAGIDDRNVGLNLSKSLFNDRLSISVGSTIATGGANTGGQTSNQVIGDFTVAYKITPNGSMTLRFFRRNEQNQLGMGSNTTERIGASLAHSKSFNTIRELFTSRSRKRKPLKTKTVDDATTAGERPRGQGDEQSGNKQ
jgi:hypothetical protein